MEKKLYMVETISTFRMRYVVEANEESHALDEVTCQLGLDGSSFKEFSQNHVDETIFSSREITDDEFLKEFDKDNSYLASWPIHNKREYINEIDYDK